MRLSETAFAKINLALHVRRRRSDGYHELETIFAFCEDGDCLTAEPAPEISLSITGPFSEGLSFGPDNLVVRAATALRDVLGFPEGAALTLDKRLPIAAGIGGGSADAAATLRLLAQLWDVEIPKSLAESLGADVPACLLSLAVRGDGVGEVLTSLDQQGISGQPILLVNPMRPCPTGLVFSGWDGIDRGELLDWRFGRNDLEPAATKLIPEISNLLQQMRALAGAHFVRMSGSGATCFALFDDIESRDNAAEIVALDHPDWWTMPSLLR
jgi:4-diphosphocytidyl-2-C-methyl-D-erythritol kinase